MKGLFIPSERVEEYTAMVSECGNIPVEVVSTFANAVLLYENDDRLSLAKLFHANGDDTSAKVYNTEEAGLIRKLAEPKPKNMDAVDYEARYKGYDWLEDQNIIEYRRSKAAHKAWTTTRFWESEVLAGNFTHTVKITYTVGYQTCVYEDVAVCVAHGRALSKKAIKKITRDLFPKDYDDRNKVWRPFDARIKAMDFKVEIKAK